MIDLSAGAPVWFGNAFATMNSLILPSAGVVELQTLQWGLGDQGKLVLMAALGSVAGRTSMRERFLLFSKDQLKGG